MLSLIKLAGAVRTTECHLGTIKVGNVFGNNILPTERTIRIDVSRFHCRYLIDKLARISIQLAFAVIAAEADEVALVVGRCLDGIAAEWASVVYRGGLDF